jgi:hypothetical protein
MSDLRNEGAAPTPGRRTRSWDSGAPAGQERTVSFESEERYWTDYLRVALPVIGLLLMLALFWWWAQQFIGNDKDPNQVAFDATQTSEIATRPAPTPTNTAEVVVEATQVEVAPTEPPSTGNTGTNGNGQETTPSDTSGSAQGCDFKKGDYVIVTQDGNGLRLRSKPELSDDVIVTSLDAGTELRVIEDCFVEDAEGNQYLRVRDEATSRSGYVSAEFVEPKPAGD